MKNLSSKFILSNVLTAIWLIWSGQYLREQHDFLLNGKDALYGSFILVLFLAGSFFSILKARQLSFSSDRKTSRFERFILVVLYIFAMGANMFVYFFGSSLIFGGQEHVPDWMQVVGICIMLITFTLLCIEGYSIGYPPKRGLSPQMERISNFIVMMYIGAGVSLVWNGGILGGNARLSIDQPDFWSELIACIVLVFMIVLPFQRLFWYEVFSSSHSRSDNWKVAGSLVLVILSAIIPLFF